MKNQKFLLSVTRIEKKGLKSIRNFKPLTENLRPNTKLALLSNLFTNIRRLTQLYMAMFVKDGVWLQTISFVAMNLLAVIYLLFFPGTPGDNNFGPAPSANTLGVKILALTMPILALVGILAAVLIPMLAGSA